MAHVRKLFKYKVLTPFIRPSIFFSTYNHYKPINYNLCQVKPCVNYKQDYRTIQFPVKDTESEIQLLHRIFPQPKEMFYYALNAAYILEVGKDLAPCVSYEHLSFGIGNEKLWRVIINMKWPENFEVEGIGTRKSEAETVAYLYACKQLKKLGVLDETNKLLIHQNALSVKDKSVKVAKADLYNIFQQLWIRHGKKEYLPKFNSFTVEGVFDNKKFWKTELSLLYPEKKEFEAIALRIRDAEAIASAKALVWLHEQGVINKNRRLVKYTKDDELKIQNAHSMPYPISIPGQTLLNMENVLASFEKQNFDLTDSVCDLPDNENTADTSVIYNIITDEIYEIPTAEELNKRSQEMYERRKNVLDNSTEELQQITKTRLSLPICQKKVQILEKISNNQVVVLSGETGCGKTTQVPQFILDDFIDEMKGASCNIIVTQPRRISAVSIADRVAKERGENLGDTVGYQIRLDKCLPSNNGAILYCTTGMLLRKLYSNPHLDGISHVIVDEVHERNIYIDFLLILLRNVLKTNKDLKLLLMSASFNTHLFTQYFENSAVIHVPGKTFPVAEYFLEDLTGILPSSNLQNKSPKLDVDSVVNIINHIDETQPNGAILTFLPGWHDIRCVHNGLVETKNASNLVIYPIHSRLAQEDQKRIFDTPEDGKRKVILATNIAETSITVNDVVYVVNSGLHKGTLLDKDGGIASLMTQWITKANVRQRRGRAGRVRPGKCYHLFTRKVLLEMEEYPVAELLRIPLESVILDCKLYCPDLKAETFLSQALQPPDAFAVHCGIQELQTLGVLDKDENLTNLGKIVVHFGCHPRLSVALVYAAFFGCLDPVLTMCAALTVEKEPFLNTLEDKHQIKRIKQIHDNGIFSDHLALYNIYKNWRSLDESEIPNFLEKYLLDEQCLDRIKQLKYLFAEDLYNAGIISDISAYEDKMNECNSNSSHIPTLLAVLTSAFYPNAVKIVQGEISQGKLNKDAVIYLLVKGQRGYIQKESVVHEEHELPYPWLVYFSALKSEARRLAMMSAVSSVPGISFLLLGGKDIDFAKVPEDNSEECVLVIDGIKKLNFSCSEKEARLLLDWREYLNRMFQIYVRSLLTEDQKKGQLNQLSRAEFLTVTRDLLATPQVPFTKGQIYKFVNGHLESIEL